VPPSAGWETVATFSMFTAILLASEIFQATQIYTWPGYGKIYLMDEFVIVFDDRARRWLNEHPNQDSLVIAYSDTRC